MVENIYQVINEEDVNQILNEHKSKLVVFFVVDNANSPLVKKIKVNLFSLAQSHLQVFFGYIDSKNFERNSKSPVLNMNNLHKFYFYYNLHELNEYSMIDFNTFMNEFNKFNSKIEQYKQQFLETEKNEPDIGTSIQQLQSKPSELIETCSNNEEEKKEADNVSINKDELEKLLKLKKLMDTVENKDQPLQQNQLNKMEELQQLNNMKYKIQLDKIQQ